MILRGLIEILFPSQCIGCGAMLLPAQEGFCSLCEVTLEEIHSPICCVCGLPFASANADHQCGACMLSPPHFDFARSLFLYGGGVAQAIKSFKYGGQLFSGDILGKMLALKFVNFLSEKNFNVIVPVPLHVKRLQKRGFNQSVIIAGKLSRMTHLKLNCHNLLRIRNTPSQGGLTRPQRIENVRAAFGVSKPRAFKDKRVLLIDDVITTSATVNECAATLKRAGAVEVGVLSIGRAIF